MKLVDALQSEHNSVNILNLFENYFPPEASAPAITLYRQMHSALRDKIPLVFEGGQTAVLNWLPAWLGQRDPGMLYFSDDQLRFYNAQQRQSRPVTSPQQPSIPYGWCPLPELSIPAQFVEPLKNAHHDFWDKPIAWTNDEGNEKKRGELLKTTNEIIVPVIELLKHQCQVSTKIEKMQLNKDIDTVSFILQLSENPSNIMFESDRPGIIKLFGDTTNNRLRVNQKTINTGGRIKFDYALKQTSPPSPSLHLVLKELATTIKSRISGTQQASHMTVQNEALRILESLRGNTQIDLELGLLTNQAPFDFTWENGKIIKTTLQHSKDLYIYAIIAMLEIN